MFEAIRTTRSKSNQRGPDRLIKQSEAWLLTFKGAGKKLILNKTNIHGSRSGEGSQFPEWAIVRSLATKANRDQNDNHQQNFEDIQEFLESFEGIEWVPVTDEGPVNSLRDIEPGIV